MRILRGLSSRLLPCGCLAGVYETYEAEVVAILDARGPSCRNADHVAGNVIPVDPAAPDAAPSEEPARTDR